MNFDRMGFPAAEYPHHGTATTAPQDDESTSTAPAAGEDVYVAARARSEQRQHDVDFGGSG
jgi:hypothetical protein